MKFQEKFEGVCESSSKKITKKKKFNLNPKNIQNKSKTWVILKKERQRRQV